MPVRVSNTITGSAALISSTAAVWVAVFGFTATAFARTGEPSMMVLPAGVSSWLSDATIEPFSCGPTVRVWLSAAMA